MPDVDAKEAMEWFDKWELTPETADQILSNFSAFLCYQTGGRLSKIGYSLETMKTYADDYLNEILLKELDEKLKEQEERFKAQEMLINAMTSRRMNNGAFD